MSSLNERSESQPRWQFRLSTVFLLATLFAVYLTAFRFAPYLVYACSISTLSYLVAFASYNQQRLTAGEYPAVVAAAHAMVGGLVWAAVAYVSARTTLTHDVVAGMFGAFTGAGIGLFFSLAGVGIFFFLHE